jgi:hypothetical protein
MALPAIAALARPCASRKDAKDAKVEEKVQPGWTLLLNHLGSQACAEQAIKSSFLCALCVFAFFALKAFLFL